MTPQEKPSALGSATAAKPPDAVAIGTVSAVGPSPGVWSGFAAAYQEVTYKVLSFTSKMTTSKPERIVVKHPVVRQSRTADIDYPQLKPDLFRVGAELALFLYWANNEWVTTDENSGVLPVTPEVRKMVGQ